MSATSVTGKGAGAAGNLKGPGNGRNHFVPSVTPHVVAADEIALVAGAATVEVPGLSGVNYTVQAQDITTPSNTVAVTKTNVSSTLSRLTFAGTGTDVVSYIVVKMGQAG